MKTILQKTIVTISLATFCACSKTALNSSVSPTQFKKGDFIKVAKDNFTFEDSSGKRFLPMGGYYMNEHHKIGDAYHWWENFSEKRLDHDFAMAKRLGNNTIRISLWLNIVSSNPANYIIGTDEDYEKIDTIIKTARKHGLRLYAEPRIEGTFIQDTVNFPLWKQAFHNLSKKYKDEETIFCWELDAEAVSLIGYRGDRECWENWLKNKYGNDKNIAKAWNVKTGKGWKNEIYDKYKNALHHSSEFDKLRNKKPEHWYLDSLNDEGSQALYDWQLFREHQYTEKMRTLCKIIRANDTNHLVSIDLVIWFFPLVRNLAPAGWGGPYGYAAVDFQEISKFVDFIGVHTYPLYIPAFTTEWYENLSKNEKTFNRQLRYLETMLRYIHANVEKPLPIVHSETGWHGGKGDYAGNTEEDQLRWTETLMEETKDCAVGWLNWLIKDIPSHEGLSGYIGMVGPGIKVTNDINNLNPWGNYVYDGPLPENEAYKLKALGKKFPELVKKYHNDPDVKYVKAKNQIKLSKKLLLTANNITLDKIMCDIVQSTNFPVDIILTD